MAKPPRCKFARACASTASTPIFRKTAGRMMEPAKKARCSLTSKKNIGANVVAAEDEFDDEWKSV